MNYSIKIALFLLTGALLPTLVRHAESANSFQFSPDGNLVLTGAGDGTAKLWDISVLYKFGKVKSARNYIAFDENKSYE